MPFRIGLGYDVHKLVPGRKLLIGGLVIPHHSGSLGHSDGDVLIHAIIDALLGAAGLGDIGSHFPDTDPALKGIDSKILLQETLDLVTKKQFILVNIDSTICLQQPKIGKYVAEMQSLLSNILKIEKDRVSIKATTTEELGFVGKEEGISAQAIALLKKRESDQKI